jgi:hypothetical protein
MTDTQSTGQTDETASPQTSADVDAFRARRRAVPLLPYENLETSARYIAPGFRRTVERYLTQGYVREGLSIPSLSGEIDWFAHNRSFAFHLSEWDPTTDLLMGYSVFDDARYFDVAYGYANAWLDRFHQPSLDVGPDPVALDAALGPIPWYDMAVGQRAYRLAYLLDVAARDSRFPDAEIARMLASLQFHLRVLAVPDFFRAHSNHGFYQAFGELAACRRFRDEPFAGDRYAAAAERVRLIVDGQFFPSGLHREHSPGYQYMVLGSLIGARTSGLIPSDDVAARIAAAEEVLTWQIQPGGSLLTFGDTDPRQAERGRFAADRFENPRLRYLISGGQIGERPQRGIRVFPEEGYLFARGDHPAAPGDPWWYLAQIAAFHSRVHKHADDLSFVWSDRGQEILIDPARFGYAGRTEPNSELSKQGFWYSDPKRIYVESTCAHNTVEVDGLSYNRRRKPFGSALRYAGEQSGLIVSESDLRPINPVRFIRILVMSPDHFLLVVDWLLDRSGTTHDFRQHFHFHPTWTAAHDPAAESGRLLATHDQSGQRLAVLPLLPQQGKFRIVRGQESPDLLGWYSDKPYSLIPTTTLAAEQLATDHAVFATLFTFAPDAEPAPASLTRTLRPATFAWSEGDDLLRLVITRGQDDQPVSVRLERLPLDKTD